MKRAAKGFTLLELLVVLSILSVMAAMIVPRLMDRPDQARVIAAKTDVRSIMGALRLYYLDHGSYPSTEQGLGALVKANGQGYLDASPKDPWRNDYQYLNPGTHGEIDVYSLGADGKPGGEGVNSDIGSWNLDD